jgi:putative oxidoreductase
MLANGMTAATEFFLAAAAVVEIAGAVALIVGFKTRYAALLLALYLVPVTLVFHDFWAFTGMERKAQLINFLKNVAIGGGLVYVAAAGARALSLDQRRQQRRERARPMREVRA